LASILFVAERRLFLSTLLSCTEKLSPSAAAPVAAAPAPAIEQPQDGTVPMELDRADDKENSSPAQLNQTSSNRGDKQSAAAVKPGAPQDRIQALRDTLSTSLQKLKV
jgi:hypothetical protein